MSGPGDLMARIRAAERAQRQKEARERTQAVEHREVARPRSVDDAPTQTFGGQGEPLALGEDEGRPCYFLQGRKVEIGDAVDLYTNAANGWIRGRFEWGQHAGDPPQLAINIWDPQGERDSDGLPPWIGEVTANLPRNAICRWPPRRLRGDG